MYCNFHSVIFSLVILIIWACYLRALRGVVCCRSPKTLNCELFSMFAWKSNCSKQLLNIMIIYVDSKENWQIDINVRLCIPVSHTCILNLVLVFMHLAVITTQNIKQYQIPDLLIEYSACNKPF